MDCASAISFIGVAGLYEIQLARSDLPRWCEERRIQQALAIRSGTMQGADSIRPIQIHFWLGVRELATWLPLRVPGRDGELTLKAWQAAQPINDKLRELNRLMIEWLERCASSDWKLAQPR
jgi:hypothetical protein